MKPIVDAIMVGAGDLRCSLGLAVGSQHGNEPVFLDALAKVQRAADTNNLPVLGFAMTPEILQHRLERGWRAFMVHSDGYGVFKSGTESFINGVQLSEQILAKRDEKIIVNGK
jgi:2-keto-3-deoxy-L-rhamnonate aldolase RhmA